MPMYIKFDGIPGESTDEKHKGEVEVVSWDWGLSNSSPGGAVGGGPGKAQFQDFRFVKSVDSTSPELFLRCASGRHIPKAVFYARKSGEGFDYLKIAMEHVGLSSFSQAGGGEVPMENLSFNFSKMDITHTPLLRDGSAGTPITAGWDLAVGKKI